MMDSTGDRSNRPGRIRRSNPGWKKLPNVNSEPLEPPVTPKERRRPVATFTTPIGAKPHNDRFLVADFRLAKNKTRKLMDKSLAAELEGAIEKDSESLVDKVLPHLPFNPEDIMKRFSDPQTQYDPGTKGKSGCFHNRRTKKRKWHNWPKTDLQGTEPELCDYLNEVAGKVRQLINKPQSPDDLVYSSEYKGAGPPTGFTMNRKPDLVVVPRSMVRAGAGWKDFRSYVSLKVAGRPKSEEREQLSEYARIFFGTRWDRRYVLALGFLHKRLTLYYFDRSGVMYSSEYDIDENPGMFLRLAIGILFLDYGQLGYDTSFSTEPDACYLPVKGDMYRIEHAIHLDRSIRGRGTICLKVKCVNGKNEGKICVVKDSWVDRSRSTKEIEILELLKGKVPNIPDFIAGDVVKTLDDSGREVVDSTENFRRPPFEVEIRDHYRIVMTPCGAPIWEFASLTELASATLDVIEGIEALDKMGVLHRDISLFNVVLAGDNGSGIRKGYIIDFDYAIRINVSGQRIIAEGKRTGTLPFMAVAVLRNMEHTAIHDAESMFYVLIWITLTYAGPNGLRRSLSKDFDFKETVLNAWCPEGKIDNATLVEIAYKKFGVVVSPMHFEQEVLDRIHPYFKSFKKCLSYLREILFPPPAKVKLDAFNIHEDIDETPDSDGVGVDQRSNEEVFRQLKEILQWTKEKLAEKERETELAPAHQPALESGDTPAYKEVVEESHTPKYVSDLIHPMKLRERKEMQGGLEGMRPAQTEKDGSEGDPPAQTEQGESGGTPSAQTEQVPAARRQAPRRSARLESLTSRNGSTPESTSMKKRSRTTYEDKSAKAKQSDAKHTGDRLVKKSRGSEQANK